MNNLRSIILKRTDRKRKFNQMKELLDIGKININSTDEYGKTPLVWAIDREHYDLAELLIERNANVNKTDNIWGWSPLRYAIQKNNMKILKMLIKQGADLNRKDFVGKSAIFHAVDVNNKEAISLLIKAGVNPDQIDAYRRTPLHVAIISKKYDIALLLLKEGAKPNPTDTFGMTPMHWLVSSVVGEFNSKQENVLNALINKGANPHIKENSRGMTPIEMLYNKKNNRISTKFKNKFKKSILNRNKFSVERFLHNRSKMTGNKKFLKTLSPEYIDKKLKKININMGTVTSANSIKDLKNKQNYLMKLKRDMENERKRYLERTKILNKKTIVNFAKKMI